MNEKKVVVPFHGERKKIDWKKADSQKRGDTARQMCVVKP